MKNLTIYASLLMMCGLMSCSVMKESEGGVKVSDDLAYCHTKVSKSLADLGKDSIDYTMMPRNIENQDSVWACRKATPDEWCSGFWPGILWYDYESSKDAKIEEEAKKYTSSLEYLSRRPAFDHDLGFLMLCSYGQQYRLTHDEESKRVLLAAADSLATLFNPTVGTILSWPRNVEMLGGHNTIMDNMINLELLFWASKNGGSETLRDIAVAHAETTMKNQFRPDGTCFHVAVYDSETGEFIKGVTHQGYSDNSTWARGQAWAIYGYTMVYRETGDKKFLDFACKAADVYLKRLPEDMVPYWDFDDPAIPEAPRDASAACVVASALLELDNYCGENKKGYYREAAESMLASLGSEAYRSGSHKDSFLDHSTGHKPAGSEIDASIVYADYYYLEALLRLKNLQENETEQTSEGGSAPSLAVILNLLR
ncbi:MAG: glycoside hydrolase family 88 protein [Muribaculaceae bacterium]|nr:glycoside hydrolase family 88 protein [Muribaculaceae bacterium]